jgi:aerobic-type carbon monoxide dehydrogenase small subunit (CoxS/CutS family)
MNIDLHVNGHTRQVNVDPGVPLLWVIREHLGLTGTKFGCGIGLCGCCTVHVDGNAQRSCQVSAGEVEEREITTIEGLPEDHPVKTAWIAEQVPECGYCQPGQIMQAAGFLARVPRPSEVQIVEAMEGNLCRCGSYQRIKRAVARAAASVKMP